MKKDNIESAQLEMILRAVDLLGVCVNHFDERQCDFCDSLCFGTQPDQVQKYWSKRETQEVSQTLRDNTVRNDSGGG